MANALIFTQIPITERMIEDMVKRAEFRFEDPLKIEVTSQLSSTMIYLKMCGVHSDQGNFYPISGFPRYLITEDTVNGGSFENIIDKPTDLALATRLDKRAELIRERRYGGLIVANDPKIVFPSNEAVNKTAKEGGDSRSNKPFNPPKADSLPAARKDDANVTSPGEPRRVSSAPPNTADQEVAIHVLRAQADNSLPLGTKVEVEDAERLSDRAASSLTLANSLDVPYFSSDDSDGPPSDEDKEDFA